MLSESAAALLCLELRRDGLPIDRARTEQLLADALGPRPTTDAEEAASRRARDAPSSARPGRETTDLRNPAQVREMLLAVGVDVPNTRKWVLEPFRTATRSSTPCSTGGATSGSRRPTGTRGSTPTSAPTTGCAGGGPPATALPAG